MYAVTQFFLLTALPALAGRARWCVGGEVVVSGAAAGPAFAVTAGTSVVAARGQDAEMTCPVLRLGDKAVSWVRSRDLQILSHAGVVFTADTRVSVRVGTRARDSDGGKDSGGRDSGGGREKGRESEPVTRHSLRIRRLRLADAGRYECQLNTEPKMSLFFNLTVVDEPVPSMVVEVEETVVSGALGGAVTLHCSARYEPPPRALPLPPVDILWTKDGRPFTTQEGLGRSVWLQSERFTASARSRLTLGALAATDAGHYRCSAGGVAAEVMLVLNKESPMEAMQRDQSADSAPHSSRLAALALAFAVVAPNLV
ncbi:hypothetical protein ACJJTC_017146 [Scirpophaga incertulas]